ncbi:MAG: HAD family phosphatase [Robiginitomaculum sp.]|nr:HAD family phosphatase [Robiginitomaculum sp.]MDQ7078807.1 HAD family phosphatase [Robiginitomaculum sp.]
MSYKEGTRADGAQLVIFDCDGVLVDSETITNHVFSRLITKAGWPVTFEECCAQFKGLSMKDCVAKIEARLDRTLAPDWPDQYRDESYAALREHVKAMPGAKEAIALIRAAGRKMCIASSGPMEKMEITLGRTGLMADFEGMIFNAAMVAQGKPAPDLFLHAAKMMDVAPEAAIVIEDSPVGARAAKAAGMICLGYIGGELKEEEGLAREGAILIEDLCEVEKHL